MPHIAQPGFWRELFCPAFPVSAFPVSAFPSQPSTPSSHQLSCRQIETEWP